ncbi:MAG: hypothetical protein C5B52_04150 [Bacteroidetes bacterium]|nr:MAG: hypothetical protein C5B52_04150 [Bacteroidota bacterium]
MFWLKGKGVEVKNLKPGKWDLGTCLGTRYLALVASFRAVNWQSTMRSWRQSRGDYFAAVVSVFSNHHPV